MRIKARLPFDLECFVGGYMSTVDMDSSTHHPIVKHLIENHPAIEGLDSYLIFTISDSYNSNTISQALATHLVDFGKCFKCLRKIEALDVPCKCGATDFQFGDDSLNVILIDDSDPSFAMFKDLEIKSKNGEKARRKNERDGYIPSKLSEDVREAQKGKCYYCTEPTVRCGSAPNQAHLDHYDAFEGSLIDNLVIACRTCNTKKGSMHGDAYIDIVWDDLTSDQKHVSQATKKSLSKWLKSEQAEAWREYLLCR
jgi:5-methylcytosine-specific restriction endonuclease McrA